MQIIPTLLTLILVITYISYTLIQDFRVSHIETGHYIARYEVERRVVNRKAKNYFETLKEKKPQQKKTEKKIFPRTERKILQPHSLAPLLENIPPQKVVQFYEKLFLRYFASITLNGNPISEKFLQTLFSSLVAKAKELKKAGKEYDWEILLEGSPLKQKLLEGTHRIDFSSGKGYPSIREVFSFQETDVPIAFSGLPETALPLLFSEQEATLILEKEQELNKGNPLTIQELESILPSHEMLKYLHCKAAKKKGFVERDKKNIIELRVEP